jgi:multicomponent Na+:H+ antiporter subunit D
VLAGLIYAFHHALTKGLLFLSAAAIRDATGTTQLSKLGGLGQESSVFASVFFVGGLSLVGIPPLGGFFGKFFVFNAAATRFADTSGIGAALVMFVLFLGAVLTIIYSTRAWVRSFWGSQTPTVEAGALEQPQVFLLATLAAIVVLVGVGFDPVYRFADAAAEAATDTDQYIDVVLGGDSA